MAASGVARAPHPRPCTELTDEHRVGDDDVRHALGRHRGQDADGHQEGAAERHLPIGVAADQRPGKQTCGQTDRGCASGGGRGGPARDDQGQGQGRGAIGRAGNNSAGRTRPWAVRPRSPTAARSRTAPATTTRCAVFLKYCCFRRGGPSVDLLAAVPWLCPCPSCCTSSSPRTRRLPLYRFAARKSSNVKQIDGHLEDAARRGPRRRSYKCAAIPPGQCRPRPREGRRPAGGQPPVWPWPTEPAGVIVLTREVDEGVLRADDDGGPRRGHVQLLEGGAEQQAEGRLQGAGGQLEKEAHRLLQRARARPKDKVLHCTYVDHGDAQDDHPAPAAVGGPHGGRRALLGERHGRLTAAIGAAFADASARRCRHGPAKPKPAKVATKLGVAATPSRHLRQEAERCREA